MDEKINIKQILLKLISKWYYFAIAGVIIMPLAYLYIKMATENYQVRAALLLKSENPNNMGNEKFLKGMELFSSHTELEDEIGILKSYSTVERAIRELDFGVSYFVGRRFRIVEQYGEAPFTIVMDSTFNQIIDVPIYIEQVSKDKFHVKASGKHVNTYNFYTNEVEDYFPEIEIDEEAPIDKPFVHKNLSFRIQFDDKFKPKEGEEMFFVIHDLKSVAEGYKESLSIDPISRESNIVELSISGPVAIKGVRFLNKLMDVYLQNELYKKNQLGLKTIHFIDNQISGVSDSLKQVEGSLELFRSRNNILDINTTAENLTKNLDNLETEKSVLEVKLKYYKYIANALQREGQVGDIVAPSTFGVEDPLLSNLLIELSKLNQERAGLNYSARENNPLTEVIDLKIKNNKKALIQNVNNFIEASSIALNDLTSRIAQIKSNLNKLPKNERELVSIQRRFDFSDNVYNYLLEKRAEAGIAIASNSVEKTIVDRARQVGGGPVTPNRKMIYMVAFVMAIVIALAVIITMDLLNDNIISNEDVEKNTKIPLLGSITHGNRREQANIVAQAKSALGESFRTLRVNLQYLTLGKNNNVIGFTSSGESEGKTFCSVNLAAAMAQSGRKTILIDADMRRPKVATYFHLDNEWGLSNYLIGECSLRDVINETGNPGFDVITAGVIPPNPIDLIGQPRMEELIEKLKQLYTTIIIDSPPIGYVSEYVILMRYTDANIYVVRSNFTSRFRLDKINKLYDEKKITNVSILLNDVRTSRLNGYSYEYKSNYNPKPKPKLKLKTR